jgi:hypothetical protein
MLDHRHKPADIAARLQDDLGPSAFSFVSTRVEEARQASDQRRVRHWQDVANELLILGGGAQRGARRASGGSLWELMQRVEYYRHRATQAEQKAAMAPKAYRQDILELAGQWRDLALYADLQARVNGRRASRKGLRAAA